MHSLFDMITRSAKAEQEINEARIADPEDKLARAEVIDVSKLSGDIIKFGATVTLIDKTARTSGH
jgi:transcription elongation factor GreA